MTILMERMREELVRRNYASTTIHSYLKAVEHFRTHADTALDEVGPDDLRSYHAYLLGTRRLAVNTVVLNICALRFLYIKVLKRRDMKEDLPYPKQRLRLPVILSPDEVAQLIGAAQNLYHRTILMTLYSTGLRRAELCRLKVADVDSKRMMLRVVQGKGGIDREVPLSKKLLGALREYYRWMRPETYLFPGTVNHSRADKPITAKIVWQAVHEATIRAGIKKRVTPHTLRHYLPFRTMSSSHSALTKLGRNSRRNAKSPWRSPNIVGCHLQTVQEREEPVARFVPAGFCLRRGCPRQRFFLHGKCCLEINLCGLNTFVTEPQCDHRAVNSIFEKVHGHGVPQAVDGDPLLLQGGAVHGSHGAMLVQQVLYTMDAEAFPLSVWEQHVSVTSLALAQPGFQHDDYRSGDGCTAFLAPFADYSHVGVRAEDDVFAF